MVWHDCKSDPPKKSGQYILVYKIIKENKIYWNSSYYGNDGIWYTSLYCEHTYNRCYCELIKWAEVDLAEVVKNDLK